MSENIKSKFQIQILNERILDNNPTADYNDFCPLSDYGGKTSLNDITVKNLFMYNQLWMELGDLYSDYAKCSGLPECAFWVFYTLYESKDIYTQKDLSEKWSLSRQTVNSALKKLEAESLIEIVPLPGQKKNKQIVLTETGNVLAQKVIVPVIKAEQNAFSSLSGEEQEILLYLTQKYLRILQKEIK